MHDVVTSGLEWSTEPVRDVLVDQNISRGVMTREERNLRRVGRVQQSLTDVLALEVGKLSQDLIGCPVGSDQPYDVGQP